MAERLAGTGFDVVVPDLRGFGRSDEHDRDPAECYGARAQARSVAGLLDELGVSAAVVGGYDIGGRVGSQLAVDRPDLVRALVVAPPAPGVGRRVLDEHPIREFWYQSFHQLELARDLIDGDVSRARAYLKHFWSRWSGPDYTVDDERLNHLAAAYGAPGRSSRRSAGTARERNGRPPIAETEPDPADRIAVPTTFLWPEHDPLFPARGPTGSTRSSRT